MWWWGPCAGSSCSTAVVLPRRQLAAALYDELVPLLTDGRPRAMTDEDSDAYASEDATFALRASASGIAVEPGIYRARDVRTHDAVALKVFDKAILKNKATRRRLRHEIRIISRVGAHPNVLRLYGVYSSRRTFQIAFELARCGEVMHRIAASSSPTSSPPPSVSPVDLDLDLDLSAQTPPPYRVTEHEISRIIASAASALQFMHARGIVHGEIRPEHLLYSDLEPDARVVLVDFGRAAAWREFTFRSRVHRGKFLWHDRHSLRFLPPAVLQQCPPDGVADWPHAQQIDVWSLGVTMFVLLCGAFPFGGHATLDEIREGVLHEKLTFPKNVPLSRAARDLLTKLLEKDPMRAPSMDEVCAHPWLCSDVAADVRWSEAQIRAFGVFAKRYERSVAASSLRRHTADDHTEPPLSSSSSSRLLHDRDCSSQSSPLPYDVFGVSSGDRHKTTSNGDRPDVPDRFGPDTERPSFISTDGNVPASDSSERLSADAYMRIANAEVEALTIRKAIAASASSSPTRHEEITAHRTIRVSAAASGDSMLLAKDHELPRAVKRDVWPRRLFASLKSHSFRSASSGSSS